MFGLGWGEREMDVTRGNQMSKWPTQDFSLFWDFGVFTMSSQDFFLTILAHIVIGFVSSTIYIDGKIGRPTFNLP